MTNFEKIKTSTEEDASEILMEIIDLYLEIGFSGRSESVTYDEISRHILEWLKEEV